MHKHDFIFHNEMKDVPCSGGGHTSFMVLICGCGAVDFFPRFNFNLATEQFRQDFVDMLPKPFFVVEPFDPRRI